MLILRLALLILLVFLWVKRADIVAFFATISYNKGNAHKALDIFKTADKIGNLSPSNRYAYAFLLLRAGELEKSRIILNKITMGVAKPNMKNNARSLLALISWKTGDIDGAIDSMEDLISSYKNSNMYQYLGLLYILKRDKENSLRVCKEAYEYNSDDKVIIDNLAEAYMLNEDYEKAREKYEELLKLEPSFPEAFYGYGLNLIKLGEKEKGLDFIKQSLDKNFTFLSAATKEDIEKLYQENL